MRKMPVIEIENGKVKSIDGAGVGTDEFKIETKKLTLSLADMTYMKGDVSNSKNPSLLYRTIIFDKHLWKNIVFARFSISDYRDVTQIKSINLGSFTQKYPDANIIDAEGAPISQSTTDYNLPLAGIGNVIIKCSDKPPLYSTPWYYARNALSGGYIAGPTLDVNANVTLTGSVVDVLFYYEAVIK